jgi:hypothetical protein
MPKKKMRPRSPGIKSLDAGAAVPATFSPRYAFVVQFRSGDAKNGGRVEHMPSGNATLFEDPNELFEFFCRILRTAEKPSKEKGSVLGPL